jgi:hypothetical protein
MMLDELTTVLCPVADCMGIAKEHESAAVEENLHRQHGKEWPLPSTVDWPLDVQIVMDSTTWPTWRLNCEIWHTGEDLTADEVLYIAAVLNMNALHVSELNKAIGNRLR